MRALELVCSRGRAKPSRAGRHGSVTCTSAGSGARQFGFKIALLGQWAAAKLHCLSISPSRFRKKSQLKAKKKQVSKLMGMAVIGDCNLHPDELAPLKSARCFTQAAQASEFEFRLFKF